MTKLEVSRLDGVFCVIDRQGRPRPLRLIGEPVREFNPGWQPRGACDSFAPWTVLDLVHASGREASWLLSDGMEHWDKSISALPEAARMRVVEQVTPAIRAIHQALLCAPQPSLPPELALFDGLNREAIVEIVGMAADHAIGRTRGIELYRDEPDAAGSQECPTANGPVRLGAIAECLAGNFQQDLQAALTDGWLSCSSPVDGRPLRSRDSLVLHEHRIAYRFVDERHGLVFHLGATHHAFAKSDLFVPSINTVFLPHEGDKPPATLARDCLTHAIAEAPAMLAYLMASDRRFAVVCRGYPHLHIGHQVWNELTGLDRLVREVPAAALPTVIVPDASEGSEVFAPIDRIFPELAGRVDRGLRSPETLGAFAYRNRYCVFRALDEHVTQALARRIRDAAGDEPPNRDDARLAARIREEKIPCVLFGLRVENRTAVNPGAVVADCIEHLRQRLGRIVVVLDGHNARLHHDPVSLYGSHGQGLHEPPIFTELRLVMQLHNRFDNTGVEIVNLCGASMARSLFWSRQADFFVAFWGAGLAKYRWICNRPGLVLSNGWNLRHRGDLDIYHAPRYHEGGTAMRLIDAAYINDMAEAPVLFSPTANPIPQYGNFRVDHAGLLLELDAMVAEHLARVLG